jgi:hypothetical protein
MPLWQRSNCCLIFSRHRPARDDSQAGTPPFVRRRSASRVMVAAVTNKAVTAIFVVSASRNMSSGDIVRGISRSDQETGFARMAHTGGPARPQS